MSRPIFIATAVMTSVFMFSTVAQAASGKPVRTVEPSKVAKAKPVPPRDRSKLFAPDTGVDTTASVASGGPKHGCGTIACKNYTIMGVGF